ncbi:MAG: translation initiation factor IF-2 [Rickettsiaceae bacterium]|nr:translation initiation factor IF-2 [Rickettsiaceae bacterium]
MVDSKDTDKKAPKKLTLGSSKLSLGNTVFPKKVTKTLGRASGSTVVVEVKRGKVFSGSTSSLEKSTGNQAVDEGHVNRRLSALQKAKEKTDTDKTIGSLSKLAQMNQLTKEEKLVEDNIVEETVEEQKKETVATEDKKIVEPEVSSQEAEGVKQKPIATDSYKEDFKSKNIEEEKTAPTTKPKITEPKKLKKSDIISMLDEDSGQSPYKTRSLASIKRARAKEKRKNEVKKQEKIYREVIIPEVISVGELSNRMTERAADVIRELMKLGIMASSTQSIDADTAEIIVTTFGHTPRRVQESDIENILQPTEDDPKDLKSRAPIVTVMGHVDHGKTSLLDALKLTDVVAGEVGGITQHIGAYSIILSDDKMITFIDTPGHEAFTEMRTRGAKITDIVVLVVAADDGIKAQTIEAINHAKAAEVPIIVAINKIDKPEINIDKVKNELLSHELIPEDLGGDIITVPVSAVAKTNLDKLEESILLVAEMMDLKSNPTADASGVVVESRMDKRQGVVATIIVQRGTLKKGDLIVAGTTYGRVRLINNDKGRSIKEAYPSLAAEIYGLNEAPSSGDVFNVVTTEKQARDITEYRIRKLKETQVTASSKSSNLEDLFNKALGAGEMKELSLIIKGDVHGSIEAIINSLNKIESDEVKLKILHSAVGGINESDISLAIASGAMVIGFNVRAGANVTTEAEKHKVDIRYYSIIYDLINDIKAVMSGMLTPLIKEIYIGSVEIREVFNISKIGKIAGSYVTKGAIKKGAGVRLLRDNIVIHEGKLKTLKRFKDEVAEVKEGTECGIAFENYSDIKVGDTVEVFEIVEEKKQL